MNLPNKLTVLRMLLVPVFVFFLLEPRIPYHAMWAFFVFGIAALTDTFDGQIARRRNLVTTFGKFLDPLADKVLVLSAMLCFTQMGLCSAVVVIIITTREFMVTSLRLVAAADGIVIAANFLGKVKTVVQMGSVIVVLWLLMFEQLSLPIADVVLVSNIFMWLTALITVISGADYLYRNRGVIAEY